MHIISTAIAYVTHDLDHFIEEIIELQGTQGHLCWSRHERNIGMCDWRPDEDFGSAFLESMVVCPRRIGRG